MFFCSIFSIVAGGSLGPEAPIVALSAGVVSYISRNILAHKGRMLRYCTLMGMGAALAAFFGVGIGGKAGDSDLFWSLPCLLVELCTLVCCFTSRNFSLRGHSTVVANNST